MEKTKTDLAVIGVKAGINLVPFIGGAIASLIGDCIPFSTQKAIEETLTMLNKRLSDFESRIDVKNINTEEFSELFKSCYLVIVRTNQKSKLQAAAALIANLLLKKGDSEKFSYQELDHYVRCLDGASIGAIEVLGNAYALAKQDKFRNFKTDSYKFNFERLRPLTPGGSASLIMGLVGELNGMGLLRICQIPLVQTAEYGNFPLELTPLGSSFVNHILAPIAEIATGA